MYIAQPRRQQFASLQVTAQYAQCHIRATGQGGTEPIDTPVPSPAECRGIRRHGAGAAAPHGKPHQPRQIAKQVTQVLLQQRIKRVQAPLLVFHLQGLQLIEQVGMATHRALAEDHKGTGQDVGPLHGNGDRQGVVGRRHEIARPQLNGPAAHYIHAVVDQLAHALGGVVLGHGRQHRGRPVFQAPRNQLPHGLQGIGAGGDFGRGLLYALEFSHLHIELATDTRERTDRQVTHLGTGCRQRRQRDTAAGAQALDQHAPTFARHGRATDNPVDGNEHILALYRAIHERRTGIVAAADLHPGVIGRQQCAGDAVVHRIGVTEQAVGIAQLKRQAHHGGNRGQRNPAFAEREFKSQHLLALELATADQADIRNGARIRSRFGPGQAKAG